MRGLARAGLGPLDRHCAAVFDTLGHAKELHPGKRNSLDALCERYGIDNSHRTLHGALLDANLLAEVYLAMTRGQDSLIIDAAPTPKAEAAARAALGELTLIVLPATDEEIAAHAQQLADIDKASRGKCLWKKLEVTLAAA